MRKSGCASMPDLSLASWRRRARGIALLGSAAGACVLPVQARAVEFQHYKSVITAYEDSLEISAIAQISGGGIGLVASTFLASRARETLPKVGYTALMALTTATTFNGIELLNRGDAVTHDARMLGAFERELAGADDSAAGRFDRGQRARMMSRLATASLQRLREERDSARIWKSLASFAAAGCGGYALARTPLESAVSQVGLGLFTLATTFLGVSYLLPAEGSSDLSRLGARLVPAGEGLALAVSYRL